MQFPRSVRKNVVVSSSFLNRLRIHDANYTILLGISQRLLQKKLKKKAREKMPIFFHFVILAVENDTRCYGELGCLNITRSWYNLPIRPINVFPLQRDVINTRFILYTQDNPTEVSIFVQFTVFATKIDKKYSFLLN